MLDRSHFFVSKELTQGIFSEESRALDPLNVVVSGWQVYDNKGRVVEQYEPFFSQGLDDYELPIVIVCEEDE